MDKYYIARNKKSGLHLFVCDDEYDKPRKETTSGCNFWTTDGGAKTIIKLPDNWFKREIKWKDENPKELEIKQKDDNIENTKIYIVRIKKLGLFMFLIEKSYEGKEIVKNIKLPDDLYPEIKSNIKEPTEFKLK